MSKTIKQVLVVGDTKYVPKEGIKITFQEEIAISQQKFDKVLTQKDIVELYKKGMVVEVTDTIDYICTEKLEYSSSGKDIIKELEDKTYLPVSKIDLILTDYKLRVDE